MEYYVALKEFSVSVGETYTHSELQYAKGFTLYTNPTDIMTNYAWGVAEAIYLVVPLSNIERNKQGNYICNKISVLKKLGWDEVAQYPIIVRTREEADERVPYSVTVDTADYKNVKADDIDKSVYFSGKVVVAGGDWSISNVKQPESIAVTLGESCIACAEREDGRSITNSPGSIATVKKEDSIALSLAEASLATAKGEGSMALAFGAESLAFAENVDSVAISYGVRSYACGKVGSWLVLVERDDENEIGKIIDIKAIYVDGVKYKENKYYKLEKGKIVSY
jgi:hypothetical protein